MAGARFAWVRFPTRRAAGLIAAGLAKKKKTPAKKATAIRKGDPTLSKVKNAADTSQMKRLEAAVEAARDEDMDRQLEAILERGRRSTRQKKRR